MKFLCASDEWFKSLGKPTATYKTSEHNSAAGVWKRKWGVIVATENSLGNWANPQSIDKGFIDLLNGLFASGVSTNPKDKCATCGYWNCDCKPDEKSGAFLGRTK